MGDERQASEMSPSPSQPTSAAVAPGDGQQAGGSGTSRRMTRRRLIGAIGVAGLGAGLGGHLLERPSRASATTRSLSKANAGKRRGATASKKRLSQWTMIIDLRTCDGCGLCTTACQKAHYLPEDIAWIKVYDMTGPDGRTYKLPKPCMMCEKPPCVPVCPVGATFRTEEGNVLIDQTVCIGCRTCMAACPYESRYFNTETTQNVPSQPFPTSPEWPVPQVKDTVGKCMFCAARLHAGVLPECVSGCPMGAIYIGDLTTDVAVNNLGDAIKVSEFLRKNDSFRLKEELGTSPRVYYIPGHGPDWMEHE